MGKWAKRIVIAVVGLVAVKYCGEKFGDYASKPIVEQNKRENTACSKICGGYNLVLVDNNNQCLCKKAE